MTDRTRYAIGIDIGGTFTDCAVIGLQNLRVTVTKVPTTPADPSIGFFDVVDAIAAKMELTTQGLLERTDRIVHGTTHGTNAVVSRHGVRVGLIATMGHGDVMSVMKGGGRTSGLAPDRFLHTPSTGKPEPYIPRERIVEVPERMDSDGDIVAPLDEEVARERIAELLEQGVDAIAISLLWSIRNPAHEIRLREMVHELAPHVYVCCACDLGVSVGEYPRTMATVINAYIGPLMHDYVGRIERGAAERGYAGQVLFAQCAGGAITGDDVRAAPIRTLQSGPVGGVTASAFLGRALVMPNIITADMGGTTLDVAVIREGQPMTRYLSLFERFQLALPMIDLDSIGAGGGSIAWVDGSGGIQVGPRSAGAVPGPACYGKGGVEPAVTDADVVLNVIDPDTFLHGKLTLDKPASERAIDELGAKLGLSRMETAAGINRLVDNRMADLIQRMGVMRGFDPRDFVLFAFGGGGPVHAAAMAKEAGIGKVVVPLLNASAVWSAFGAATSDIAYVHQEPVRIAYPDAADSVEPLFARLEARARAALPEGMSAAAPPTVERFIRMRYALQVHDVEIPLEWRLDTVEQQRQFTERFHDHYEQIFGQGAGYRRGGVMLTGLGIRLTIPTPKPLITQVERGPAEIGERDVFWPDLGRFCPTKVVRVDGPGPAGRMEGPLLIELPDTVAPVPPGQAAWFDDFGNLIIEVNGQGSNDAV
ncbi:N-methylhydantoinase A [Sphingobium faniae]|nr:N-methylhydantoinase A [Sphingobium faniae]